MGQPVPCRFCWRDVALSVGATLVIFCLLSWTGDAERLRLHGNDCYQYLEMARNIVRGNGPATSLLHYDENQSQGVIPAPQTVFPPGYPIAIAGLEILGVPEQAAGIAISLSAFACILVLVLNLGRLLDIREGILWCVLFLVIANGSAWVSALRIYSESLFTALGLLALTFFVKAESLEDSWPRVGCLLAGALAAGASYWVRYAGCFLIASVGFTISGGGSHPLAEVASVICR